MRNRTLYGPSCLRTAAPRSPAAAKRAPPQQTTNQTATGQTIATAARRDAKIPRIKPSSPNSETNTALLNVTARRMQYNQLGIDCRRTFLRLCYQEMFTAKNSFVLIAFLTLLLCRQSLAQQASSPAAAGDGGAAQLAAYRAELAALRHEFAGKTDLPDVPFFLLGMGQRTKLIYKGGTLIDVASGRTLRSWSVRKQAIVPPAYSVFLTTTAGAAVRIVEDERAVWIEEPGRRQARRHAARRSPAQLPRPPLRGHSPRAAPGVAL